MNLKTFATMSIAACGLLLTSCSANVSREQAIKFVQTHYAKSPDTAISTKQALTAQGWGANEASKESAKILAETIAMESFKMDIELDNNLHYWGSYSDKYNMPKCTEDDIFESTDEIKCSWKINGEKLTQTASYYSKEEGEETMSTSWNNKGYPYRFYIYISIKIPAEDIDCYIKLTMAYHY